MDVVHKEVRKNILSNINQIVDEIFFRNIILECVNIHNNYWDKVTGYKPSFLIKNEDEEIHEEVVNNIKKNIKY